MSEKREETGLEAWQREMRDGIGVERRIRRFWRASKWYLLAWAFVLATAPYMADSYGPYFIGGFLGLFAYLTALKCLNIWEQQASYNDTMGIVASMRAKEESP